MEIRQCDKCKREKPYYEFFPEFDTICIECSRKINKELKLLKGVEERRGEYE